VDQSAADMETETQKPQNQKNYENCPKHIEPPVLIREHPNKYMMTGGHFRICTRLLRRADAQPEAAWSILTSILNRQLRAL
jgi:hypothetical protein